MTTENNTKRLVSEAAEKSVEESKNQEGGNSTLVQAHKMIVLIVIIAVVALASFGISMLITSALIDTHNQRQLDEFVADARAFVDVNWGNEMSAVLTSEGSQLQQDEPIDTTLPVDDISDTATQEEVSQEQIAFEDMSDAEFVAYWLGESDIVNITDILVSFEVAMAMPDGWSAVEQDFLQLPPDFQRLMYDVFSVWIEHISVGSVAHEDIGRVLGDEAVQFVITMENTIGFW